MKKKKSSNFGYLLTEGFRGIFLHGFMSFAAITVTVACLVIMGSFSLILYNLNLNIKDAEQQNEVLVYIDENLSTAEAKSIGSKINLIANVKEAIFESREVALEDFIRTQGESESFTGVNANDLRDRFRVVMEDITKTSDTVKEILKIEGIAKANYDQKIIDGFTTIQSVLNIASFAIILVLFVVSLFIISNTIKLAMYDRRDEIAIMKMVGATNSFIRFPYVVEGFIIGLVSAVLSFFAQWGLYDLVSGRIEAADSLQLFKIVPFQYVLWPMAAVFAVAGLAVGVFGSILSIRKFLDV